LGEVAFGERWTRWVGRVSVLGTVGARAVGPMGGSVGASLFPGLEQLLGASLLNLCVVLGFQFSLLVIVCLLCFFEDVD
jgi:hypothetical protein